MKKKAMSVSAADGTCRLAEAASSLNSSFVKQRLCMSTLHWRTQRRQRCMVSLTATSLGPVPASRGDHCTAFRIRNCPRDPRRPPSSPRDGLLQGKAQKQTLGAQHLQTMRRENSQRWSKETFKPGSQRSSGTGSGRASCQMLCPRQVNRRMCSSKPCRLSRPMMSTAQPL